MFFQYMYIITEWHNCLIPCDQYFPLREPLRVPPEACINCSIWRRSDKERVWYEWCAEVVSIVGDGEVVLNTGYVHNPGGRSYHVRL